MEKINQSVADPFEFYSELKTQFDLYKTAMRLPGKVQEWEIWSGAFNREVKAQIHDIPGPSRLYRFQYILILWSFHNRLINEFKKPAIFQKKRVNKKLKISIKRITELFEKGLPE